MEPICMDCDGKCLSQVVVCCESCGKEVRIGCGENPSDESITDGLCEECYEA